MPSIFRLPKFQLFIYQKNRREHPFLKECKGRQPNEYMGDESSLDKGWLTCHLDRPTVKECHYCTYQHDVKMKPKRELMFMLWVFEWKNIGNGERGREMTLIVNKAYRFHYYLNKKQTELINKTIGCSRFLFNCFLASKRKKTFTVYH